MKFRLKFFWMIVGAVAMAMGGVVFWPGTGGNFVEVDIAKGATARQAALTLKDAALLTTPYSFIFWTRVRLAGAGLRVGRYKFSSGRSAFWIVDDLLHGRTEKSKVIVPEGFATWQIAERLSETKLCEKDAFLAAARADNAEGFLFPATYNIDYGHTPEDILRIMRTRFDKEWTPGLEDRAKSWGWTKEKAVTFASILERELRFRDELPMISALYHNRLQKFMPLQADPTVQYALGYWKTRLSYDDYHKTKSPYNTYLHLGLPPGPICSPGLESLKAALWPANSDVLYMLAQPDGHHTFSASYRDHTNKVNRRNKERHKQK